MINQGTEVKKAIQDPQTTKLSIPLVCDSKAINMPSTTRTRWLLFAIRFGRARTWVAFLQHHCICRIHKRTVGTNEMCKLPCSTLGSIVCVIARNGEFAQA
uniref:AlNc14C146G7382 protein n=1 Tax=Albugo laibachii Nc14 TaxID=890382 RepID=F0WLJ4_9STRA|nr:AlNc14C146G7382 [Albugo laibachii Nc14]CCA24238.1 AlNc14C228G9258 [Albugo laibachii Nc14]|eukprot:CCA24238.1 AlNc14C228G9258 [Albugo laibachii Nc14]